jgi:hypothetical protein
LVLKAPAPGDAFDLDDAGGPGYRAAQAKRVVASPAGHGRI